MRGLFFCLLLLSISASAKEFGFGPCCSGSPCGIIPCDNACAGAAFVQMGATLSTSINTLERVTRELDQRTNALSEPAVAFYSDYGEQRQTRLNAILTALDAISKSHDINTDKTMTAFSVLADSISTSLTSNTKRLVTTQNVQQHEQTLGPSSGGYTIDTLTNASESVNNVLAVSYPTATALLQKWSVVNDVESAFVREGGFTPSQSDIATLDTLSLTEYLLMGERDNQRLHDHLIKLAYSGVNTPDFTRFSSFLTWNERIDDDSLSVSEHVNELSRLPLLNPDHGATIRTASKAALYRELTMQQQLSNTLLNQLQKQL